MKKLVQNENNNVKKRKTQGRNAKKERKNKWEGKRVKNDEEWRQN